MNKLQFEEYDFTVSEYYLPYLINGDSDDLEDRDLELLYKFEKRLLDLMTREKTMHYHIALENDVDPYFTKCDVCGLKSDCVDITVNFKTSV